MNHHKMWIFFALMLTPCIAQMDDQAASDFFTASNVRVNYETRGSTATIWLRMDTPQDVMCAVWYKQQQPSTSRLPTSAQLAAMEMTSPTTDHDVHLPRLLQPQDQTAQEQLNVTAVVTVFLISGEIYRSGEYKFDVPVERDMSIAPDVNLITSETESTSAKQMSPQRSGQQDMIGSVTEVGAFFASLSLRSSTSEIAISTIRFWEVGSEATTSRLVRTLHTEGISDHSLTFQALSPETSYEGTLILVDLSNELIGVAFPEWITLEDTNTLMQYGENLASFALGASVFGVSSVYSSMFDGDKAIDGMTNTAWSSRGDGNGAWIAIDLGTEEEIMGVGFWTRTMGTSAQITQFRVSDLTDSSNRVILGYFDLPDANQLYQFSLGQPHTLRIIRFDVMESSGGNTGAISIEVYGNIGGRSGAPTEAPTGATIGAPTNDFDRTERTSAPTIAGVDTVATPIPPPMPGMRQASPPSSTSSSGFFHPWLIGIVFSSLVASFIVLNSW